MIAHYLLINLLIMHINKRKQSGHIDNRKEYGPWIKVHLFIDKEVNLSREHDNSKYLCTLRFQIYEANADKSIIVKIRQINSHSWNFNNLFQ